MPEEVDKIFMGSIYYPDQKALMLWALYSKEKRPFIMETNEAFGHLMIQQVGKNDPRVTAKLNLDVAKINQDQIEFLVRENNAYKGLYEKANEEVQWLQERLLHQSFSPSIDELDMVLETDRKVMDARTDTMYWKTKSEKLIKQVESVR